MKEIFSVNSGARVAKNSLWKKKKAVHELGRVYRSGTLVIKGKPPSFFFNRSYICLPSFNYGFSKGA